MSDERAAERGSRVPRRRRTGPPEEGRLAGDGKGQRLAEMLEDVVAASAPGTRLPSERELARRHGVARMTVRGAVDRLVSQGLVHRVQGQGTFVSESRVAQPSSLTSFSEDMAARGMTPGSILLSQEVLPAPAPIAVRLELAVHDPVVRIERIRTGDGEPISLERAYLPAERFPGLERRDLSSRSLYRTLAEDYDCEPAVSEQRIAAVSLGGTEAHLLHTAAGTPALRIERVTRDRAGATIEIVRSVYRGDRYELHTHQQRGADLPIAAPASPPTPAQDGR